MSAGKELLIDAEKWQAFEQEAGAPVMTFMHHEFGAKIYDGGPTNDGGATLFWSDFVANDWAEHYSDLPTAVARLAVLIKCVDSEEFFRDGPEGFVRWSDNFFQRTITVTPQPNVPGGLDL